MCMYLHEIEDVVNEFVNDNKMFTAWDVTTTVRKRSKDRVQHFEVKKEVHRMFDNGGMDTYCRQLANLPNVNPQPWLYYPPTADPTLYGQLPAVPAVAVLPAPSSMSSVDDDGSDIAADGSVVYKFDTTDRLCVPNKLIRELNLKTGDYVSLVCTVPPTSEVCVVEKNGCFPGTPPHLSSVIASYAVDSYDNVRISRSALQKIGINGVAFEINRDNQAIRIKKYA